MEQARVGLQLPITCSLEMLVFTIFERGSSEPSGFYQLPIAATYHDTFLDTQDEYKYYPLANSNPFLAKMIGGTQNVNGGYIVPGQQKILLVVQMWL